MAKDKRETKGSPREDRPTNQPSQTSSRPAEQQPVSQNPQGQSGSSNEEALKHVGHRGGKATDFGSTSYQED